MRGERKGEWRVIELCKLFLPLPHRTAVASALDHSALSLSAAACTHAGINRPIDVIRCIIERAAPYNTFPFQHIDMTAATHATHRPAEAAVTGNATRRRLADLLG